MICMTNKPSKNCKHCGKIVSDNKVFCDFLCRNAHAKIEPTHGEPSRASKLCEVCGEEFFFNSSMRKRAVVCSRKCLGTWQIIQRTGLLIKGGKYKSDRTFRQMARKLFVDRCAICGWNETPCDVCHIVARKDGGENIFENVVMLCPNHHRMFDRGLLAKELILLARATILSDYSKIIR